MNIERQSVRQRDKRTYRSDKTVAVAHVVRVPRMEHERTVLINAVLYHRDLVVRGVCNLLKNARRILHQVVYQIFVLCTRRNHKSRHCLPKQVCVVGVCVCRLALRAVCVPFKRNTVCAHKVAVVTHIAVCRDLLDIARVKLVPKQNHALRHCLRIGYAVKIPVGVKRLVFAYVLVRKKLKYAEQFCPERFPVNAGDSVVFVLHHCIKLRHFKQMLKARIKSRIDKACGAVRCRVNIVYVLLYIVGNLVYISFAVIVQIARREGHRDSCAVSQFLPVVGAHLNVRPRYIRHCNLYVIIAAVVPPRYVILNRGRLVYYRVNVL